MAEYKPVKQLTQARAILKINGEVIGSSNSCSYRIDATMDDVQPMGNVEAVGYVTTSVRYSGDISFFKMVDKGLRDMGYFPANGRQWITFSELEMELEDLITNETIEQLTGVKFSGMSIGFAQGVLTMEDCSFVCTKVVPTSELSG